LPHGKGVVLPVLGVKAVAAVGLQNKARRHVAVRIQRKGQPVAVHVRGGQLAAQQGIPLRNGHIRMGAGYGRVVGTRHLDGQLGSGFAAVAVFHLVGHHHGLHLTGLQAVIGGVGGVKGVGAVPVQRKARRGSAYQRIGQRIAVHIRGFQLAGHEFRLFRHKAFFHQQRGCLGHGLIVGARHGNGEGGGIRKPCGIGNGIGKIKGDRLTLLKAVVIRNIGIERIRAVALEYQSGGSSAHQRVSQHITGIRVRGGNSAGNRARTLHGRNQFGGSHGGFVHILHGNGNGRFGHITCHIRHNHGVHTGAGRSFIIQQRGGCSRFRQRDDTGYRINDKVPVFGNVGNRVVAVLESVGGHPVQVVGIHAAHNGSGCRIFIHSKGLVIDQRPGSVNGHHNCAGRVGNIARRIHLHGKNTMHAVRQHRGSDRPRAVSGHNAAAHIAQPHHIQCHHGTGFARAGEGGRVIGRQVVGIRNARIRKGCQIRYRRRCRRRGVGRVSGNAPVQKISGKIASKAPDSATLLFKHLRHKGPQSAAVEQFAQIGLINRPATALRGTTRGGLHGFSPQRRQQQPGGHNRSVGKHKDYAFLAFLAF